jgi:hypothetical protein
MPVTAAARLHWHALQRRLRDRARIGIAAAEGFSPPWRTEKTS